MRQGFECKIKKQEKMDNSNIYQNAIQAVEGGTKF